MFSQGSDNSVSVSHPGMAELKLKRADTATLRITVTNHDGSIELDDVSVTVDGFGIYITKTDNPLVIDNAAPESKYWIEVEKTGWYLADATPYDILNQARLDRGLGINVESPGPNETLAVTLKMRPTGIVEAQWDPDEVTPAHYVAQHEDITAAVAASSVEEVLRRRAADAETKLIIHTHAVPDNTHVRVEVFHGTEDAYDMTLRAARGITEGLIVHNNLVIDSETGTHPVFEFEEEGDGHDLWGVPKADAGEGEIAHDPFYYFKVTLLDNGPFGQEEAWSNALRLLYFHLGLGDAIADGDCLGNLGSLEVASFYATVSQQDRDDSSGIGCWFNQSDPDRRLWGHALRNTYSYCHLMHGTVSHVGRTRLFGHHESCFVIGGHPQVGTATDEY